MIRKKREVIAPGKTYGNLTVISKAPYRERDSAPQWYCKCKCGNETIALASSLRAGDKRYCSDCTAVRYRESKITHGLSYHPMARTYNAMMQRCYNKNSSDYKHYGGRGISVSDDLNTLEKFVRNSPPGFEKGLTIDRIDNDGNYELGNIRWASRKVQGNNRRTNRLVRDPNTGEEMTAMELADKYGIDGNLVAGRFRRGITNPENILKEKLKGGKERLPDNKVREVKQLLWGHTVFEVSCLTGISETHCRRIRDGTMYSEVSEFDDG